jgi:hypothetical protein
MNAACHNTVAQMLASLPPRKAVVEFGSRNVNGTVRDLFNGASYVGVDRVAGEGVDVLTDATIFLPDSDPDTVVCLNMLEHAEAPETVVGNACRILQPGGWLILSAAGPGWPAHGAEGGEVEEGECYQPITVGWLRERLSALGMEHVQVRESENLVYALAQKPGEAQIPPSEREIALDMQRTAHLRLNVGCGDWPLLWWQNLDSNPACPADIHADATEYLLSVDEGTFAEIYAGHFLEHLSFPEAQTFLAAAYRALQPGGKLGVVVPDTREILKRWLAGTIDAVEYPLGQWHSMDDLDEICHLFVYSDVQDSPHRWAWELKTLGRAMAAAGLEALREIDRYRDPRLGNGNWYQAGVDGFKPKEEAK